VPPGDAAALGAALRQVLDDGSLGAALAAAGAVRAATFSMDGLAEHYLELYRSAIAGVAPV
jgi:phosphatidylinositol alpha-mannosyltransferase